MRPRILLDACVLYPTVMREMLLEAAKAGAFTPLWSPRILEEWRLAAARGGPVAAMQGRADVARAQADFPKAVVHPRTRDLSRLYLPDANDIHVLAAAIAGSADLIMTLNAKDFPKDILAEEGLTRLDPDGFLYALWLDRPELVEEISAHIYANALSAGEGRASVSALLKAARLPRLAKALRES